MKLIFGSVSLAAAMMLGAAQAENVKFHDVEMIKLAQQSGCVACHTIARGGKGPQGLKPIGPAWQDVADKYRDDPNALDNLVSEVLHGTNPYESHWKGKVSGVAMPPNDVAITEHGAKKLITWILKL